MSARIASLALSIGLIASLNRARKPTVAKVSIRIDNYLYVVGYRHPVNTGDKSAVLRPYFPNPNLVSLARYSRSADVDVVATGGEVDACA